MHISRRLEHLANIIQCQPSIYSHIWDCCCDHGLLGMMLLNHHSFADTKTIAQPTIHFVDCVPSIITALAAKLTERYPTSQHRVNLPPRASCSPTPTWQTHCIDAATLPLQQFPQSKHLVVIAGIGGDLAAQLTTQLMTKHTQGMHIDFLLCPIHRTYTLRQTLISLGTSLISESLIAENGYFYEAILVTNQQTTHSESISPIGSELWEVTDHTQREIALAYAAQHIAHYQRALHSTPNADKLLSAYQAIQLKLQ